MLSFVDLFYAAATTISIPYLLVNLLKDKRYTDRLSERFGFIPGRISNNKSIWFHCSSLGEVNTIKPIVRWLNQNKPEIETFITTMTKAGRLSATQINKASVFYPPLDLSIVVATFLQKIRPSLIVLVEQELWPNLILTARSRRIPIVLINARMTQESFSRYSMIRGFYKSLLRKIDFIMTQNKEYMLRYFKLGALQERLCTTGNIKFDSLPQIDESSERSKYIQLLSIRENETVIVAGSTSEPDEQYLADTYSTIRNLRPNLRLIIAPRHMERVEEIQKIIEKRGLRCYKFSQISGHRLSFDSGDVVLVDTLGELYKIYTVADIVFVGGTFSDRGGQSVIEPASLGKPIIVGNMINNIKQEVELLKSINAIKGLDNPSQLKDNLLELINHENMRLEMGSQASKAVSNFKGSLEKTMDILKTYF